MSGARHTPGPWASRLPVGPSIRPGVAWTICGAPDASGGWVAVADVLGTGPACEDTDESRANARLIAAAPDLLAELEQTSDWLTERAKMLRQLADQAPGVMRKRNEHLRQLRDEAARFDGRAAVIRQTILKATQGA